MSYLGQGPFQEFTNPPTKDSFTGDGSTVAFDLAKAVPSGSQNALEVYVNNVRQEPGSGKAFTLGVDGSSDTKRITFSTAPANGASIYVINDKTNSTIVAPLQNDLNGTELILDVDGDTSITADTDDRIDFKIANTDHISIGTSSGDTIIKPMVDAKDIMFQQYDGRDVLEINDAGYVALHNGTTGSGQLRIYEDDDNGANFTAFQVGTQAADITYTLPTADGSSGQAITTNGSGVLTFSTVSANVPTSADGQALGSASLEWSDLFLADASDGAALGTSSLEFSDLFLADASTIQFGNDQDVILTHVADTGLLLSGTNVIQFNDASQNIGAPSATILDINATDEVELNATLVDVNANLDVSGSYTGAGLMTTGGNIVIPNNGNIGSAGDTDAMAISSGGVVTFSQNPVFPDGGVPIADLDIDGGTDIGADLTTSDLIVVDDGAGGTNRKAALSRVVTLVQANIDDPTALAIALG